MTEEREKTKMENNELERRIDRYAQKVSDTEKVVKEHLKMLQDNGEISYCLYRIDSSLTIDFEKGRYFYFNVGFKDIERSKKFEQTIYVNEPTDKFIERFDKSLARMKELAIEEEEKN